jgi:predicted nucleic acid-binding protein
MDLLIGSVAIAENLTLITTDQTHFEQLQKIASEFKVEFWVK